MGRHCCVSGCSTGVNLPSHMFPRDATLMNKWKKAIYSEKIHNLTDEQLKKCIVCYRHFADNDYEATYKLRRLKPGVVPSLYLPSNSNNNSEVKQEGNDNNNSNANNDNIEADTTVRELNIETKNTDITVREPNIQTINTDTIVREPNIEIDTDTTLDIEEIETIEIIEEQSSVEVPQSINTPIIKKSSESESSLQKNLTHSLDLHTSLHGKYFHKFTPKMWKLYKLLCILRKKQEIVVKRQLSFRERIRQAKQYSKSPAIEKLLSSLTSAQRTFLQMQIKASKYAPRDKHFTLDEKIAALSIMKQSSKCYQYLTQVFHLPSICTLRSILHAINIHPGPINFINRHLKEQVRLMKKRDKVCLLMWDEMLLQPHLNYDTTKKHILGFEDFGNNRRARFADHALVFMVRGIQTGWKFPLAYYFCDGITKTDQLIQWIRNIVKIIIDSGLYLVAFMCNDERRNRAAINKLKLESARLKSKERQVYYGYITLRKQDIIPLYDPPHLIKSIRNNLLNNDLEIDYVAEEQKFASWEIIEQAYYMDLTHNVYRLMPKITVEHIIKNKIKKKRVKNAAQVLSMTMGGFIHHHTKLEGCVNTIYGPLKMPEKQGRDTAEIILFFDQLFDSVNGHTLKPEKPLRIAVSHNSPHFPFWKRAIKRLQGMRFVDPKDKNQLKDSTILKNWISTVRGLRKLWTILKMYKFKCLKPRILNLDSLRHFFGQIKSFGVRNANPTCAEFENSFKTLLINNLTSPRTVENDSENKVDGSLLFTLKNFICTERKCNEKCSTEDLQILDSEIEIKFLDTMHDYLHICNSIAAKILNNSRIKGCVTCKNLLINTAKAELAPSDDLLKAFKHADDILTQGISRVCYMHHTALMLEIELYTQIDLYWLNCQEHNVLVKEFLISYIVVFYICKWCSGINDILMGKENRESDSSGNAQ